MNNLQTYCVDECGCVISDYEREDILNERGSISKGLSTQERKNRCGSERTHGSKNSRIEEAGKTRLDLMDWLESASLFSLNLRIMLKLGLCQGIQPPFPSMYGMVYPYVM